MIERGSKPASPLPWDARLAEIADLRGDVILLVEQGSLTAHEALVNLDYAARCASRWNELCDERDHHRKTLQQLINVALANGWTEVQDIISERHPKLYKEQSE